MRNIIEYLRCNLDDGQDILLTMDEAHRVVEGYDAITHAAHWTNEPPRVAGWYWWRSGPGQNATTIRVHEYIKAVFLGEPCDPEEKVIGYWDQNGTFRTDFDRGEWAGPIAPPID